jgi:nicotinate-nucleotide adenylyltransferase
MNMGVLGGTFDPVHLGHISLAVEACRQLKMSKVVFVPAGRQYFKAAALMSLAEDRINMLKLALTDKPDFEISLLEIQRPGPSYAVETLARIKEPLETGDELFFILGWDSLLTLPRWQEPERLLALCKLVAAPRPGYPEPDMSALEKELPGITESTLVLDRPVMDISATEIRERVKEGLPIDDMVTPEVAQYIREKGLYKAKQTSRPVY